MFSQACVSHSIHKGLYPSMHLGRGVCGKGVRTVSVWTGDVHFNPQMAIDAVGMHPIGMLSCYPGYFLTQK